MARSPKAPKFAAFNTFPNCFGSKQDDKREIWDYLDSSKPLVLEIGCGKAELGLELARRYPQKNFIGIDLKADRLYVPASAALEEELSNIAFLQLNTKDLLEYLKHCSVEEIWLTFPDPYPKDRHSKHRMSGGQFLTIYHQLLKPEGLFHFKTDDKNLFDWSLDEIQQSKLFDVGFITKDLHQEKGQQDAKILTTYEQRFQQEGLKTKYLMAAKV